MYRLGPAGNSKAFYDSGGKSSLEVPKWLYSLGLNAYEYQAVRGVRIKENTATALGKEAIKYDIELSLHSPYYVNLCTSDKEKIKKTKEHLLKSMRVAKWMGAKKVVFHPGSLGNFTREEAFSNAAKTLEELLVRDVPLWNVEKAILCPETMGKTNQLGTLEEVLELCKLFDLKPTIDFGHLHAREKGKLDSKEAFLQVIDKIESELGNSTVNKLHCHFSPVEFGEKGERRHLSTLDDKYGPKFHFFAEVIKKKKLEPTIICESSNRQAEDALIFKNIVES